LKTSVYKSSGRAKQEKRQVRKERVLMLKKMNQWFSGNPKWLCSDQAYNMPPSAGPIPLISAPHI
jgi:hypothetical protein